MTPEMQDSELRGYLTVLWRRKLLIVLLIGVTVAGAFFYTQEQTPLYRSSAQVLVFPVSLPLQGQTSFPSVNISSEQLIATSPGVVGLAMRELANDGIRPGTVSVEGSVDEQTLLFLAEASRPVSAQATAQAHADAYLEYRRDRLQQDLEIGRDAIDQVIDDLNQQIAEAEVDLAEARAAGEGPPGDVLELRISALSTQVSTQQAALNELLLAGSVPVGQVVTPAGLPRDPSSPDLQRNLLLGLLLGQALGVGFAFLIERLDERVRRREDVEESTGAPLLARVPSTAMPARGAVIVEDPMSDASEAYRSLRTHVLYSSSQLGARVIIVTSSQDGEGKTTTAVNLAAALAHSGKLTVLVSADLRRPGLSELFGDEGLPGLTDVLVGEADLIAALVPTDVGNLSVLPVGQPVDNPAELLGSEAMRTVVTQLASHAEFVIVDAPPVVGAADTPTMAAFIRWVLFVADARRSRRSGMAEAIIELRSVGASVLGVVLTRVSRRDHASYPSYSYRQKPQANGPGPSRRAGSSPLARRSRRL